jgi:hypothetical protein
VSVFTWKILAAERGIRTPGRSFGPYNGLAKEAVSAPVVWNKELSVARLPRCRVKKAVFGTSCSPNCSPILFDFSKYVNLFSTTHLWNNYPYTLR